MTPQTTFTVRNLLTITVALAGFIFLALLACSLLFRIKIKQVYNSIDKLEYHGFGENLFLIIVIISQFMAHATIIYILSLAFKFQFPSQIGIAYIISALPQALFVEGSAHLIIKKSDKKKIEEYAKTKSIEHVNEAMQEFKDFLNN